MKSLRNDVINLSDNTHVWIEIYQEFYHCFVYIANEGCHIRIIFNSDDVYIFRVLNTDNMSIVGVTIDYGPFGFMDKYDPNFICNGSGNDSVFWHSSFEKWPIT